MRLDGFDYASDANYFLTIVTAGRSCVLGMVANDEVVLSPIGRIVEQIWLATPSIRQEVRLGPFVVMPNHLHALVELRTDASQQTVAPALAPLKGPGRRSIASLVGGFKAAATLECRRAGVIGPDQPLWQRNYYEHIVRGSDDWSAIEAYIDQNPQRWSEDRENTDLSQWAGDLPVAPTGR